jgi:HEAT repeat protein
MFFFGPPDINKMLAQRNVNRLIKALNYHKDKYIQMNAIKALGKLGDKRAVEPLVSILIISNGNYHRENPALGEYAILALGDIGDAGAVKPLIDSMTFNSPLGAVVKSLVKIGTPAVEPLISALRTQEDWDIKIRTIEALGKIGDIRAVKPLVYAYKETDQPSPYYKRDTSGSTCETIEKYNRLQELLFKQTINNRRTEIVYAVRRIGQSSTPILRELLEDNDMVIQAIATILLKDLSGNKS